MRLRKLKAAGVLVHLCSGLPIQPEYAAIGRSVRPGEGIHHAKAFRRNEYLLIGSANWTTSSKCNTELNVLLQLTPAGQRAWNASFTRVLDRSTPMTQEIEAEQEAQQHALEIQHVDASVYKLMA